MTKEKSCPTGQCEVVQEFIRDSKNREEREQNFQTVTLTKLSEVSSQLAPIKVLIKDIAGIKGKIHQMELAAKDDEINTLKRRAKEKDTVFKAIRAVSNKAAKLTADLDGKIDDHFHGFLKFKWKLIGICLGVNFTWTIAAFIISKVWG